MGFHRDEEAILTCMRLQTVINRNVIITCEHFMWLSDFSILIPTGSYLFRVNMPGSSLFQNPCAKMAKMQKNDRLRFIAYSLFVYFKSSLKYVDIHFSVLMVVHFTF